MFRARKYLFFLRLFKLVRLFPGFIKRKIVWLFLFTILNSVLEIMGLAMFLPVLGILLEDDYMEKYTFLQVMYQTFSFRSVEQFTVILLLTVVFVFIVKNVIYLLLNRVQALYTFSIQTFVSKEMFKAYLNSDLRTIKRYNSNILVWKTNTLPSFFSKFVIIPLIQFTNELLVLLLILTALLIYNPYVILLLFGVVMPVTYIFYSLSKNKIKQKQEELSQVQPQINKIVQQGIFGIIDVLMSRTQKFFISLYHRWLLRAQKLNASLYTYMLIPSKLIESVVIMSAVLLVIYGVLIIKDNTQTLTLIGVFSIAAYRIIPSVNKMTVSVLNAKSYEYVLSHLLQGFNILQRSHIKKQKQSFAVKDFSCSIKITHLSFGYTPHNNVLKDINMEIKKGQNIGIIGKSGSGKSTLMNLLLGFYGNYEGEVLIDGIPLGKVNMDDWYKLIGYVQQNIFLVDGTIEENIAFGVPHEDIDYNKLNEVIKKSSLEPFINSLPQGVKTRVGELGGLVSGGQKQRIGIARALYAGAQILFFDEATSALDHETEMQITEALGVLSKNDKELTIVTIAHRYTTLKYCDVIYELDEGKIKNVLKYEDLIAKIK